MSQPFQIKLNTSAIVHVPIQYYNEDFLFIVNGKEFHTKRLIADLLSTKISHLHSVDPTIYKYCINTEEKGDFSHILNLINFAKNDVPEKEYAFIIEVIGLLENDSIEMTENDESTEITLNNVFDKIQKHERYSKYYSKSLHKEIEFISSHFSEIDEQMKEKLIKFKLSTLCEIFENEKLKLKDEDQLFEIVNELYSKDSNYSILYETVDFLNVSNECIDEFTSQFDMNDLTNGIWVKICERLKQTQKTSKKQNSQKNTGITLNYSEGQPFSGIINYLKKHCNNNIDNEINLTASSYFDSSEKYQIKNVMSFDNPDNGFATKWYNPGSWLCIDFTRHRIIPTHYTLKSLGSYFPGSIYSLKSWVIETSNDNKSWDVIDEVKNNSQLKGDLFVHTFKIQKPQDKEIRYFRIRSTDSDWCGSHYIALNSIEVFGTII